MKITYHKTVDILVYFDDEYERTFRDVDMDKIVDSVEDEMWSHHFSTASVCDSYTGELIITIEKEGY